jgi:hypothetical protein
MSLFKYPVLDLSPSSDNSSLADAAERDRIKSILSDWACDWAPDWAFDRAPTWVSSLNSGSGSPSGVGKSANGFQTVIIPSLVEFFILIFNFAHDDPLIHETQPFQLLHWFCEILTSHYQPIALSSPSVPVINILGDASTSWRK